MNKSGEITEKKFDAIFKEYFKPLVHFALKYLDNIDDAKEIVQEVFLNFWKKRKTINPDKSIKSYLFTSVYNRCLNFIRDNKKFVRDEKILDFQYNNIENQEKYLEISAKINQTLDSLPKKCRQVFVLSRFENMKNDEIAKKLGISKRTVESHISNALKHLRNNLKTFLTIIVWILIILTVFL